MVFSMYDPKLLEGVRTIHFIGCGGSGTYPLIQILHSRGYAITVAEDAHTTANRPAAQAVTLIDHYNDVWRTLTVPGNPVRVKYVETILAEWQTN